MYSWDGVYESVPDYNNKIEERFKLHKSDVFAKRPMITTAKFQKNTKQRPHWHRELH